MKMLLNRGARSFRFSTEAIAQKTFSKFTERYTANVAEFQKKISNTTVEGEQIKRSTQRAYVHPLNDAHKRAFNGVAESLRT